MVVFSNILKQEATLSPAPIPRALSNVTFCEVASATVAGAAEVVLRQGASWILPRLESSLLRHQEATLLWPCALTSAQGYKFIVSHTGIPPPHQSLAAFFCI